MFKGSRACWMMMSVSPCHQACKLGGIALPESLIPIPNLKLVETHTDLEFVLRMRLLAYSLRKPPNMWKGMWEAT
jgi:hypothetical protein